jgi:hypothetical protein
MLLCERCGVEIADDAAYCRQCGLRTLSSWAAPTPKVQVGTTTTTGGGNAFSTLAVFFGVVAVLNVAVGALAVALASLALVRSEQSSRFAIVVAVGGAVIGVVVRTFVLDSP